MHLLMDLCLRPVRARSNRRRALTAAVVLLGLAGGAAAEDQLLVNGDAETGDLTGWTAVPPRAPISADDLVVQTLGPVTALGGTYFFSFADAPQSGTVSLIQGGTLLDAPAQLCLSGSYQTEFQDRAEAILRLRSDVGLVVAEATSGPLTGSDLAWTPFIVGVEVPPAAVSWEVELRGTRFTSTFINVFYDNLSLGPPVFADLDCDGVVGPSDLAILLGGWGGTGPANLDGVGTVDAADLALLLGAWSG